MSTLPLAPPASRFARVEILAAERRLLVDGEPVALGSRAFDLLAALVARRDRVVPKEELIETVWPGLIVEDNNLQVQVSALRKALGTQAIATIPGRGYQFTLATAAVPVAAPEPAPTPLPRDTAAVRPSRLLVADDNRVNRLLLCRALDLMGHAVTSVDDGRAALDALAREPFDLLLLDLEMPELDGFAVLERRAADAALQSVPVIVTSSVEGSAKVARCLELGADDFLHKPVDPVLLKARVASSLERKHLRDRQRELIARLAPGLDAASAAGSAGERVHATILSARLHGIDASAPGRSPHARTPNDTLDLLSNASTLMLDAIERSGGVVMHWTGERVTAVFGPDLDDPAATAATAALEMQDMLAAFDGERGASAAPAVALAVGLASGEVTAGPVRAARRVVHACVGAAVQRAEELAALAGPSARAPMSVALDDATRAVLSPGLRLRLHVA